MKLAYAKFYLPRAWRYRREGAFWFFVQCAFLRERPDGTFGGLL